jgi:hypothetical protein
MVQVNGHLTAPFPIQCSVRQGIPLRIMLFTLYINTLIYHLEQHLWGIRVNRRQRKTPVVAYADVTVLVSAQQEIVAIVEAVR